MQKIQIIRLGEVVPVLAHGMSFGQRPGPGLSKGVKWLTGYSGSVSLVLDARQGQLQEFIESARGFNDGRLCFNRFGFGSRGNEARWVSKNAHALLSAGVEITGAWRVMLGMTDAIIEVCVSSDCSDKAIFF